MAVLANPYGSNYEVSQGKDLTIATPRDLSWYRDTYGANYPLYVDSTFRAVNRYGAGSYPTIYVIDAKGKVAYAHQGQIPPSVLSRAIAPLLPPR
jgi:peroxiredoxin